MLKRREVILSQPVDRSQKSVPTWHLIEPDNGPFCGHEDTCLLVDLNVLFFRSVLGYAHQVKLDIATTQLTANSVQNIWQLSDIKQLRLHTWNVPGYPDDLTLLSYNVPTTPGVTGNDVIWS